jgi:hypothetical protein
VENTPETSVDLITEHVFIPVLQRHIVDFNLKQQQLKKLLLLLKYSDYNLIKMKKKYIIFFLSALILPSCKKESANNIPESVYASRIEFSKEEHIIHSDSIMLLKTYNQLSSFATDDTTDIIVAYNYKMHALDMININNKNVFQIPLTGNGPQAISPHISDFFVHNTDSIWICTQEAIFLIDMNGVIKEKIPIVKQKNSFVINDINFSIASIRLYYNPIRKSLFYAVQQMSEASPEFIVKEYILQSGKTIDYKLQPSIIEPYISSSYGWKRLPNINFSDDKILYNYPIESTVYTINLPDNKRNMYGGQSRYVENRVHKIPENSSFEMAERHKIENVHFFDVMYNPRLRLYFRFHVGTAEYKEDIDSFNLFHLKDLYVMVFNDKFEIVNEIKLESKRYSYINAWCTVNNGILIFVDNPFSGLPFLEDDVLYDILIREREKGRLAENGLKGIKASSPDCPPNKERMCMVAQRYKQSGI